MPAYKFSSKATFPPPPLFICAINPVTSSLLPVVLGVGAGGTCTINAAARQAAQAMTGTGGAKADYLSAGRALEQNRDWSAAIDAYLKARGAAASATSTDTKSLPTCHRAPALSIRANLDVLKLSVWASHLFYLLQSDPPHCLLFARLCFSTA